VRVRVCSPVRVTARVRLCLYSHLGSVRSQQRVLIENVTVSLQSLTDGSGWLMLCSSGTGAVANHWPTSPDRINQPLRATIRTNTTHNTP